MSNGFQLSLATATRSILKQRGCLSSPYGVKGCWWPVLSPACWSYPRSPAGSATLARPGIV